MWGGMFSYLPEWTVFLQGFIVFFIPYAISTFFNWIRNLDGD